MNTGNEFADWSGFLYQLSNLLIYLRSTAE